MELFLWGLAVGGVVGIGGKRIAKPVAKGYSVVADKTREVAGNARDSFRGVIEEARSEREQALARHNQAAEEALVEAARPARRRRRAAARGGT
jgi:hypothetical protein